MASATHLASTVNLEADFSSEKSKYTVAVTEAGSVTWVYQSGNGGPENEGLQEMVPQEEILAVSVINKGETNHALGFKLCYVKHKKKNILSQTHKSFYGANEDCQSMVIVIQELISTAPLRPRKALVFVNPFCGRKLGVKIYETQVAPIFNNCGLQTNVIVTERADQMEEVLSVYDLRSIDSIVLVGGDGSYHQVANALLKRLHIEAGVDLEDPETALQELKLPIGMIPGGTGNGVAQMCYGTQDAETAAITIIKGRRRRSNVFSVFADGKFLTFAIILVGFGLIAELVQRTEGMRYLGFSRYVVAVIESFIIKPHRGMDVTFEFLKPIADEASADDLGMDTSNKKNAIQKQLDEPVDVNEEKENKDNVVQATAGKGQTREGETPPLPSDSTSTSPLKFEWHSERKDIISTTGFTPDFYSVFLGQQFSLARAGLLFSKPSTRWQMMKFFYRDATWNKTMFESDAVEHRSHYGYRVRLNSPDDSETDTSGKQLNIDGELYTMKEPAFEVSGSVLYENPNHLNIANGEPP